MQVSLCEWLCKNHNAAHWVALWLCLLNWIVHTVGDSNSAGAEERKLHKKRQNRMWQEETALPHLSDFFFLWTTNLLNSLGHKRAEPTQLFRVICTAGNEEDSNNIAEILWIEEHKAQMANFILTGRWCPSSIAQELGSVGIQNVM